MAAVTKTVSTGERVEDRIGRLRAAFQGELAGVFDRLIRAAAAEADAAAERARAAGQTRLDAALIELEQRARESDDLTKSVRQLDTQIEELRLALHVERELVKTTAQRCEQEHTARARAEAATEAACRLQERLASEYESKLQASQTELDEERARSAGLKRQLEAQVSERAKLLTTLKTVQQACAVAETNSKAFEAARPGTEEQPAAEMASDVHHQSAATRADDGGANAPLAGESVMRDLATSLAADAKAGRKLKVAAGRPAIEVSPTLAEYGKPLFPQDPPQVSHSFRK